VEGHTLAGHKDMIHIYENCGITGRFLALQVKQKNRVPQITTSEWFQRLDKCMRNAKELMSEIDWPQLRTEVQNFHALLPVGAGY
jgi:hypothetical protein